MRSLLRRLVWFSVLALACIGLAYLAAAPISAAIKRAAGGLTIDSLATPSPSWGIANAILGGILGFFYVFYTQNKQKQGVIRTYRWAENELVKLGRIKTGEMLEYHRSYNWYSYAGIGFTTIFVVIPLLMDDKIHRNEPERLLAIIVGMALVSVATILLGIIDIVHTNTLTPLVTRERRFQIIHSVLVCGGLAQSLFIAAVGVFLTLVNTWLSLFVSIVALFLMVLLTELRGIPSAALKEEFGLTDEELRTVEKAASPRSDGSHV